MTILRVSDLRAGYGEIEVLHGISLEVEKGEIVALIGGNGAGKTTMLKTISGLIRARSGRIELEGKEIQRLSAHKIVNLGVTQAPEGRAMLTRMTVYENLQMGAYSRSDAEVGSDIDAMLERFPALKARSSQPASVLSGGEQQMLAIARALMARPRLLLLDEPSLGLAPKIMVEIFRIVHALRDEGITILLVEQNARSALRLANRAYVLERGNVVLSGTGEALLTNEQVQHMYLGQQAGEAQPATG